MDTTQYLKELEKQGKLPELLDALELPSKQFKLPDQGCKMYFSFDTEKNTECLSIETWDSDDFCFSAPKSVGNHKYKLNDYMLISGFNDPERKKLQKLLDYMKGNFESYRGNCLCFLKAKQKECIEKIDKKCEKEKEAVKSDIQDQVYRVLGLYK